MYWKTGHHEAVCIGRQVTMSAVGAVGQAACIGRQVTMRKTRLAV